MALPSVARVLPGRSTLETQPQPQAEHPFVDALAPGVLDARNQTWLSCADVRTGIGEVRRVRHVERLRPELQADTLSDTESPVDAQVDVYQTWAAQLIPAPRPEPSSSHGRISGGIEPEIAGPDNFNFRLDLVGRLVVARSVQRTTSRCDAERSARVHREQAVHLPTTQQHCAETLRCILLPTAERQFHRRHGIERMRVIEASDNLCDQRKILGRIVRVAIDAVLIPARSQCFRPRVRETHHIAGREATLQGTLQRVIPRFESPDIRVEVRIGGPTELCIKHTARVAAADVSVVGIPAILQVDLPVPDIARFGHPVVAEVFFKHQVPCLDVTAFKVGIGQFERHRRGRRDDAVAQIRRRYCRQTAADRRIELIVVRGGERVDTEHREGLQRVASDIDRIPGNAVAGANDKGIRRSVRYAQAGRKVFLTHREAAILRQAADAAHVQLTSVEVVDFQALAIDTRRNTEVIPTHAERHRQLLIDLPFIAGIQAMCPRPCITGDDARPALHRIRQAQQKRRIGIVIVHCGTQSTCYLAIEGEAPRVAGRLIAIHAHPQSVPAKAKVMLSLHPCQARHILRLW